MHYLVIVEQGPTSFGASCPDVPGCFAIGSTIQETLKLMGEALAEHLQLLKDEGDPVPLPVTTSVDAIPVNELGTVLEVNIA